MAKCECGAMSDVLPSTNARKRWHREHKVEVDRVSPEDMQRFETWRSLRGEDLERAMLDARWFVQPNDLIGGWSIMPVDRPPSSGFPEVADFLSKRAAEHIVGLHNAELVQRAEEHTEVCR